MNRSLSALLIDNVHSGEEKPNVGTCVEQRNGSGQELVAPQVVIVENRKIFTSCQLDASIPVANHPDVLRVRNIPHAAVFESRNELLSRRTRRVVDDEKFEIG